MRYLSTFEWLKHKHAAVVRGFSVAENLTRPQVSTTSPRVVIKYAAGHDSSDMAKWQHVLDYRVCWFMFHVYVKCFTAVLYASHGISVGTSVGLFMISHVDLLMNTSIYPAQGDTT